MHGGLADRVPSGVVRREAGGHEPALRGERWAGALLYRGGLVAAGAAAWIGLLAAVLVPVGAWRPWLVLPLFAAGTAAAGWAAHRVPARPVPTWTAFGCLAACVGHAIWAAATSAEQVVLRRDPGSYALFTQWIATRHRLPVDAHLAAFGGSAALADPAFRLASPGFFEVGGDVVPQFLLGAPAWFSLGWWLGGWHGLFIAPAVASGLALLAVAGLAARLCGPRCAPAVVATLGVSQPVLHAARSTYSEPLALLLVAAAAALLWDATVAADRTRRLGLAAGLAFGLAGLVRVDALREVVLLLPVAAVLALRRHPAAGPLAAGAMGGLAVAAVPAVLLSRPYLGQIAGSLLPLAAGGLVLAVVSAVVVMRVRRRGTPSAPPLRRPGYGPRIAAALVVLTGLVLASRPWWLTVRQSPRDPGSRVVAGLQLRQQLPVDGGRTYAEHSLAWVVWYLGPVTVVAAWLAFAALAAAATRWWSASRAAVDSEAGAAVPGWLGPAVVGLASTVLTLYRPGITPDHPWADRRLVSVVLPAVVLAAGAVVTWTSRRAQRRWSATLLVAVVAVACLAMLVPATMATAPVAGARTEQGELAAVRAVCAALGPREVVIAVDNRGSNEWPQAVRGVCDRPAASVRGPLAEAGASSGRLARRVLAAGYRPVLLAGTADGERVLRGLGLAPQHLVQLRTTEDQRWLTRVPDGVDQLTVDVWLARFG